MNDRQVVRCQEAAGKTVEWLQKAGFTNKERWLIYDLLHGRLKELENLKLIRNYTTTPAQENAHQKRALIKDYDQTVSADRT